MLVDYIKDIVDSDKWVVELTDGKYIVKQIIDCKECSLTQAARETGMSWIVSVIKKKLKQYLPKDVIYEVKYELINVPKPNIQIYGGIDMAKKVDTYINIPRINIQTEVDVVNNLENYTVIRRIHNNYLGAHIAYDPNVPVIGNAGMV